MEQETRQFKCTGDCIKCQPLQRQYCAAQKGHDNQRLLMALTSSIEELKAKIEAIQDNEALVFNPEEKSEIPTLSTQEGDGV